MGKNSVWGVEDEAFPFLGRTKVQGWETVNCLDWGGTSAKDRLINGRNKQC